MMITIITLLSYILNSFFTRIIFISQSEVTLLYPFIYIPLLVTMYPVFKESKTYIFYAIILGILVSSCFIRSLIFNILIFLLFAFIIIKVFKNAKYNFINVFLLSIFLIILFDVITYTTLSSSINLL